MVEAGATGLRGPSSENDGGFSLQDCACVPLPATQQTDYGDDISSLILLFEEQAEKAAAAVLTQSASDPPSSTTPSLGSLGKRKARDLSNALLSASDNRPSKKPRRDSPATNSPGEPYIIANFPTIQNYPGLPYGVLFEMARLISLNKLPYETVSTHHLELLKGCNTERASETARTLFPHASSDSVQDPAFAQEMAAKSPWEQLDKEEEALAIDPYAGLGHSDAFPGWYGGKVVFGGRLHKEQGAYRIALDRSSLGPSCRFTRRFGSKHFLRIKIPGPILHATNNQLENFFQKSFVLWGSIFRSFYAKDDTVFLFRTNEVMENGLIYPDRSPGMSLWQFIHWHNPLEANSNQAMTKWAARTALGLSNSFPGPILKAENILTEDDIVSAAGSDMTDGCGSANRSIHLQVMHMLNPETYPTAFQFRVEGNKGMLAERSDTSLHEELTVWIRPSQTKIKYPLNHHDPLDPTLRIVDILRTSYMKSPSRISSETIINLAENGVPHNVFVNLLKTNIAEVVEGLTTWEGPDAMFNLWNNVERAGAVIFSRRAREAAGEARVRGFGDRSTDVDDDDDDLDDDGIGVDKAVEERSTAWWADQTSGCPSSLEETVMVLLDSGCRPETSPILREKLKQVVTTKIKTRVLKYRYDVPFSASAFVVPDRYGVLDVNEIHFKSSRRNLKDPQGILTDTIVGDVLLTRNPCKLPTDVRKVRAVEHPLLRGYTDVIICSVQGLRRLLDYLAGGDYDGDTALVIWDPAMVEPFTNADEKYSVEPEGVDLCFTSTGNEKVTEFLERSKSLSETEKTLYTQRYLLGALRDTSVVGKYSTMHDNAIYSLGYRNPRTIKLGYKFCKVLDGAKTGLTITRNALKEDQTRYSSTLGPKWKRKAFEYGNGTYLKREKTAYISGPFVMDVLRHAAKAERKRVLAAMDTVFKPLPPGLDQHLAQPWIDAMEMAKRGRPEIVSGKLEDLSLIEAHVQSMFAEHKLFVQKDFTNLAIERRQDILRNLSRKFASSPRPEEMGTVTLDAAGISRIRASYAYIYDFKHAKNASSFSRFPWNMALRELCHIKASALGPSKTVTAGFYERFRLSRR